MDNFSAAEFIPNQQVKDEDLSIGHKTWAYMTEEEDHLSTNVKKIFFAGTMNFYVATASISLNSVNREEGKPTHGEDLCSYLLAENGNIENHKWHGSNALLLQISPYASTEEPGCRAAWLMCYEPLTESSCIFPDLFFVLFISL